MKTKGYRYVQYIICMHNVESTFTYVAVLLALSVAHDLSQLAGRRRAVLADVHALATGGAVDLADSAALVKRLGRGSAVLQLVVEYLKTKKSISLHLELT